MKHLLDVSVLLAVIVESHSQNAATQAWLKNKEIVLCPIAELGFLRISSNPRVPGLGLDMNQARAGLEKFAAERRAEWIADDLPALKSRPARSEEVTDCYLADLAAKHGLRLATLDGQIKHPSVELVS
jgi:predicted nucleic acid-binding protein